MEQEAATQLAAQANLPKPAVTCPDDLVAKVGATLECYLVGPGESEKVPVHIEVMTVTADGTANFNISVGKAAPGRATPKSPKG